MERSFDLVLVQSFDSFGKRELILSLAYASSYISSLFQNASKSDTGQQLTK